MSAPVDINIILNELGCSDGTFLPIANSENKTLIAAIADLEERKERQGFTLQDTERTLQNLKVHFEHAKQEIAQNLVSLIGDLCGGVVIYLLELPVSPLRNS